MPPTEQTFIPRTPIPPTSRSSSGLGWFMTISFLLLVASMLTSAGVWLYKGLLQSQIAGDSATLQKVQGEFDPTLILELRRTAQAIDVGRELLKNHVATSQFLKFIGDNTLPETHFTKFIYKDNDAVLTGASRSYSGLAQQALLFESSPLVKKADFSDFSLGQGGFVNFRVELILDPSVSAYQAQ